MDGNTPYSAVNCRQSTLRSLEKGHALISSRLRSVLNPLHGARTGIPLHGLRPRCTRPDDGESRAEACPPRVVAEKLSRRDFAAKHLTLAQTHEDAILVGARTSITRLTIMVVVGHKSTDSDQDHAHVIRNHLIRDIGCEKRWSRRLVHMAYGVSCFFQGLAHWTAGMVVQSESAKAGTMTSRSYCFFFCFQGPTSCLIGCQKITVKG